MTDEELGILEKKIEAPYYDSWYKQVDEKEFYDLQHAAEELLAEVRRLNSLMHGIGELLR